MNEPRSPESRSPGGVAGEDRPVISRPSDWIFLQPAILDQMHDAVIAMDLDGTVTGCNRAVQRVFGYLQEELVGKPIDLLYPEEGRKRLRDEVIPAVAATGEFRGEVTNRTRNGETVQVHVSISLLRDGDGRPAGMVGFSIDITGQRLGEMAVRRHDEVSRELVSARERSERMGLLVSAIERCPDGVALLESGNRQEAGPPIVYVNEAFQRMTGYGSQELVGTSGEQLYGPRTDKALLERIRQSLMKGQAIREELVTRRKDGTELRVDVSMVPVPGDAGQFTHWMAIQRDITEQSRLQAKLAEGESRLHFLTESIPQLVWTADRDGGCKFVSQSFAAFVGAEDRELLGEGWLRFVHPEDQHRAAEVWKESVKREQPYVSEYRLRRHDGEFVWYLDRAVLRRNELGEAVEWVGSCTDIAQQKRGEEALRQTEKLAAVGRLASSIAHEINNPLASVTNLLYLLSTQRSLDRTAREYVRSAQEELSRVSEITTQTLRFHKQASSATPTRVSEVLDAVLAMYRSRLVSSNIQVHREYERTAQLVCFAGEIRQCMATIIGNSIDACNQGGSLRIRLGHSVGWRQRQRRGIRVTLSDTGHGIAGDQMRKIFEPFFTTKGITGTGLGLWITKDLIARHDGTISMRSSTGAARHGTVVSIFLPFEPRLSARVGVAKT